MNVEKCIAPILALAMLSGCASSPIYPNLQVEAKPLTLDQVVTEPQANKGGIVIWGGHVAYVANGANGGTLYIMQLPLAKNEKPSVYCGTSGGFIATSSGFIDPEAYGYGRLVTVAGEVTGVQTATLNNVQESCPVVAIRQVYLWPVVRRDYDHNVFYGTPDYKFGPVWWWFGAVNYPYGYYYYHHAGLHEVYGAYGFEENGGVAGCP